MPQVSARVSAVVALHDQGRYLEQCLRSALDQDFRDLEVVIVDDASTDDSLDVARSLVSLDPARVRVFANETNLGVSRTRNHGAYRARGSILAFLDADDYWLPGKISAQMAAFASDPELGLCHTGVEVVCEGPTDRADALADDSLAAWASSFDQFSRDAASFGPTDYFRHLLLANNICLSSVAVRKDVFRQAGGFVDSAACQCEDWLLWLKLSAITRFRSLPGQLAAYRFHPDSHTAKVFMDPGFDYAGTRDAVVKAALSFDPARVGRMLDACRADGP